MECHHLTQPWQCDSQITYNTTRLKCCACHAKWRWTRPKRCACYNNCNASCENVAKVLRLPHTKRETCLNVTQCHSCHAKHSYATFGTPKSDERTHPQPPDPQSETGTLSTHSGIKIWIILVSMVLLCFVSWTRIIWMDRIRDSPWNSWWFGGWRRHWPEIVSGLSLMNLSSSLFVTWFIQK